MDCTHRTPRFSLSSSIFKALKTTLQFWTPLLLTFHFLHLSLHLLFSYIFFSSSFYLFNLLSSINIFWVTQSLRFSFCILFPSGPEISQGQSELQQWEFAIHEPGVTHVLVTGGAGFIGSHATLRLLSDNHRVTIVDNLSRGNLGAVKVLQGLFPEPGRLQFIYADLGDKKSVEKIFLENKFDAVMHFAAVAYVGESTMDPLKYYHNITSNTLLVLEAMAKHDVKTLIYSSTCATYGEPEKMPITEETQQVPINPYGKAKKMAEDIILDFSKTSDMAIMILRYFNVIGSDPNGNLGEAPRPELREQGRISGACFDAARGIIPGLK
ncbi:probable UDP-arabinose 4-epimerase 3 isoform X4 [Vigna radiata var. radiata]|nr:probable UDP-arabinose 4-epimerase 3 isoform X4 [Vigna radiata var. radiata]